MRDEVAFVCVPVFSRGSGKRRFLDMEIETRRVSHAATVTKGNSKIIVITATKAEMYSSISANMV